MKTLGRTLRLNDGRSKGLNGEIRLRIPFFEDARTYVRKCKKRYNLIIIDLFFADGIPEHLTTIEFYNDLKNCLYDDGILISNSITDFSNDLKNYFIK